MILVIDNYDSFVHNLARYITLAGGNPNIIRNDAITIEQIQALNPQAIVISPGPCTPQKAGISIQIVRQLGPAIPILGVCLGHQCIAESYGGLTVRGVPAHGCASVITHDGTGVFQNLPNPLRAGRYHSLATRIDEKSGLVIQAQTDDHTIMAFRHRSHPVHGVQFHPESILTEHGLTMIENFLQIAQTHHRERTAA